MSPLETQPLRASGEHGFSLIEVLVELESNGIRVDVGRLAELSREFGERLTRLEADIYELAGHPFNIASPKQLAQVLFAEQKLPELCQAAIRSKL